MESDLRGRGQLHSRTAPGCAAPLPRSPELLWHPEPASPGPEWARGRAPGWAHATSSPRRPPPGRRGPRQPGGRRAAGSAPWPGPGAVPEPTPLTPAVLGGAPPGLGSALAHAEPAAWAARPRCRGPPTGACTLPLPRLAPRARFPQEPLDSCSQVVFLIRSLPVSASRGTLDRRLQRAQQGPGGGCTGQTALALPGCRVQTPPCT